MQKIKENLESFFITWGVVLLLNQVFLFHGCFNPVCLIAALPHTGVIAFIILIFFINDAKNKNKNKKSIDIKNEYDESEIMRRYSEGYKIVRELNRKNTPSQNSIKPREQEVKIVENLISDLEKNNEIQEENKICKITQVKNFLHSFEPFEITIMDVRNNILQINTEVIDIESIDSNDYFIEIPQNDTWKNVALKSGDKCLVKKQSYGKKIELNLIEINSEKIKSKMTKLPKVQKDIEQESLKKELKTLESKLQELVEQKTEYLNNIEEFNREYNLHLGELVKDILNLKREILYKKTIKRQKQKAKYQEDIQTFQESKETIDELKSTIAELEEALESIDENDENYKELTQAYNELKEELEKLEDELEIQEKELELAKEYIDDKTIEQEYEEINNHYEGFESEYEHIKKAFENSITLNDEEKKELKSLYKQAARLCHPDIVPDELKEKAHELMQKLNDAYSKKDLSKVKEILHSLQNAPSFEVSSETIEDKELLKAKIKEYLKNIETIKSEIEEIKEDEAYQTIAALDDWDEYFEELKSNLESEKEKLIKELREGLKENIDSIIDIKTNKHDIPDWMQTLWDWADENKIPESAWVEDERLKAGGYEKGLSRNKEKLLSAKLLKLGGYNIRKIPSEIYNLENLTFISLEHNNLNKLPIRITSLSNVTYLVISFNQITSLPKELKNMIHLKSINLRSNSLFELPKEIGNLKNLMYLFLAKNQLNSLPQEICSLSSLMKLEVAFNKLKELPKEIGNLSNLIELDLFNNNLIKLPKSIMQLKLKRLKLLDNKSLMLTNEQKQWVEELQKSGCDVEIDKDLFEREYTETIQEIKPKNIVKKKNAITKENSPYSKYIQSIENIRFEKIRKYCENLSKANEADEMQKYLGENGRMHKALIYSTLEVFLEKLNGETITLCDWGCSQGIASMLVLDYIKEKQLDIKVSDVILIDDDTKALNRAIAQVEVLAQDDIKFTPIKLDDNISDTIKLVKNNRVLNLFANDKIPISFWNIDNNIFKDCHTIDHGIFEDSYFLCVSNEYKGFVDEVYKNINSFINVQDVSIRDSKIGRFDKYERIFRTLIDIDSDEIPF